MQAERSHSRQAHQSAGYKSLLPAKRPSWRQKKEGESSAFRPSDMAFVSLRLLLAAGQASDGARAAVARFGASLVDAALAASLPRTSRPQLPVPPVQPPLRPEPRAAATQATAQPPAVLTAVHRTSATSASRQLHPACTAAAQLHMPHRPTAGHAGAVAPRQHPPSATATAAAEPSPEELPAAIPAAAAQPHPPQPHCTAALRPRSSQAPRSEPPAVRSTPTVPAPPAAPAAAPTPTLVQLQAQTQQLGLMEAREQWNLLQQQQGEQRQLLQLQWQLRQCLLLQQQQRRGALSGACDRARLSTIPAAPAAAAATPAAAPAPAAAPTSTAAPSPAAAPEAVQVAAAEVAAVPHAALIPKRINTAPATSAEKARREAASACLESHAPSLAPAASPRPAVPASDGSTAAGSLRTASAISPPTSAPAVMQLSLQPGGFPAEPTSATPPTSAPALLQLHPAAIPAEPKYFTPVVVAVGDAAVADEDVALGPPRPGTPDQAGAEAPSMAPAGEDPAGAVEDGATATGTLARTPAEGQPGSLAAACGAADGLTAAPGDGGPGENQRSLPRIHPTCASWISKTQARQLRQQQQQLGDSALDALPLPERQKASGTPQLQDATTAAAAAAIDMRAAPHGPASAHAPEPLPPASAGAAEQQRLVRLQQPTRRQVRSRAALEAGALRALRNLQPRWPLARSGQPSQVPPARSPPHLRTHTAADNANSCGQCHKSYPCCKLLGQRTRMRPILLCCRMQPDRSPAPVHRRKGIWARFTRRRSMPQSHPLSGAWVLSPAPPPATTWAAAAVSAAANPATAVLTAAALKTHSMAKAHSMAGASQAAAKLALAIYR